MRRIDSPNGVTGRERIEDDAVYLLSHEHVGVEFTNGESVINFTVAAFKEMEAKRRFLLALGPPVIVRRYPGPFYPFERVVIVFGLQDLHEVYSYQYIETTEYEYGGAPQDLPNNPVAHVFHKLHPITAPK